MSRDRHSRQATEILRGLSDLPGRKSYHVQTRKLPRVLPAEPGTYYQHEEFSFSFEEQPEQMPPLVGMDDIIITIDGVLLATEAMERVLSSAHSLLASVGADSDWEMRAHVKPQDESSQAYQITLFTDVWMGSQPA